MTVTLTALSPVVFHDDKEGMLGIRVAHFLESATAKPAALPDANGIATPSTPPHRRGHRRLPHQRRQSRRRRLGHARQLVQLSGTTADGKTETIAILDHTGNPNYPTYWHARGYGLFAVNPLGAHIFDPKAPPLNFTLDAGHDITFRYRILLLPGAPTPAEMNKQADSFSAEYK